DQAGQRGLAATGRAPENHRADVVVFDGQPERFSGTKQRGLPGKFVERARTHTLGQRRAGWCFFRFEFGEKAHNWILILLTRNPARKFDRARHRKAKRDSSLRCPSTFAPLRLTLRVPSESRG